MATLEDVGRRIFGESRQASIEVLLFNLSCVIFTVYFVALAIVQAGLHLGIGLIATDVLGAATLIASVIIGNRRGIQRSLVLPLWVLMLFIFEVHWIYQGGLFGSDPIAIFPGLVAVLLIARDRRRYAAILLTVLLAAGLICVEFIRPDLIVPYGSRVEQLIDTGVTYLLSLIVLALITALYAANYRKTSEAVLERSRKIEQLTGFLRRYLPSQLVDRFETGDPGLDTKADRVKLTIFFSDIRDFTPTTDSMQPEEMTRLLNSYLTEMTLIATRWGGTIDKFVGDAMMVFFGAPTSEGDRADALKCVQMALEMQRKMIRLQKAWYAQGIENPLEIRIGINTGVATVGDFGTPDRLSYTSIGGEVNLAARLQGICDPGGILISHSTWALVNDKIACVRRPQRVIVKGIGRALTVYEVPIRKDKSARNGALSTSRITPFRAPRSVRV